MRSSRTPQRRGTRSNGTVPCLPARTRCRTPQYDVIPNVLAARYASPELVALWSPENKIVLERRLWIAVLRAQRDLGVDVPEQAIADYERVVEQVDLASIAARERVTRHDVKARIEEFCALAGHEHVHKGMTSRDLTENVEQLQIRLSLELVARPHRRAARPARPPRGRARRAGAGRAQPQRRRAGHHAGQAVRDGRGRAARGVRAAGGPARPLPAARDQGPGRHGAGHARPARRRRRASSPTLEERVAAHLGFAGVFTSVGQVYPRSLDFDVLTALVQLAAAPSSLAADDPADGRRRAGDRGVQARARSGRRRCRTR